MQKIVIDTSVIISGEIFRLIDTGHLENCELIIPVAVIDELQSQASQKKEQGFLGLDEIKKIQKISQQKGLVIKIEGQRPSLDDIKLSGRGRIDSIIKDIAKQNNATLYTSDKVQSLVSQAEGIEVNYTEPETKQEEPEFLKYFDSETMSVHLKENLAPMAKKGKPGTFNLVQIGENTLSRQYLHDMTNQILSLARLNNKTSLEISKPGAIVVQYKDYRIAITHQPFSEGYEITIVHPIVKLSLDDYSLSEKLLKRFSEKAEGILISGSPGSGKSTLASGLADFYHNSGKIVKTFESPRDLVVNPAITQYTRLDGSFENSADILLLVRPDYTIFDEVRRHEDFRIFSDLRLAGVGMVGVIHANSPVDAIQRFIGKIELGIIPSVIDTVVFVSNGQISKVYELELMVKVPSGMTEQDLARPVIEIRDFEDHTLEYEIYTFGEENVIIPVKKKSSKQGIEKLAEDKVRDTFRRFDPNAEVEVLSANSVKVKADRQFIPSIIGKGGSTINDLEKMLNVHIDVVERDSLEPSSSSFELPFDFSESRTSILFNVGKEHSGKYADIFVQDKYLSTSRIGRKGQIKFPRKSTHAKEIMRKASSQNDIQIFLKD